MYYELIYLYLGKFLHPKKVICMIVRAWNNGEWKDDGNGYGIRISKDDRDKYFQRDWGSVRIILDDRVVEVSISESFWKRCPELRSKEIGLWLIKNGLGKWPKYKPPKLKLEPMGERTFRLSLL